ncbi:hypothetical protein GNI_035340 [Gregarina niphandrodes]|uniref:Uncharacterized protein n=1 Tax=Gregarina niphandrodes TaxID=110365 RepID=A0A023BAR3_GRENI|nr:hypothetical protein GNI_035340 [Gregarina niphandrodes]EZG78504.1 hypothetical protein GNI_035340 [Gregarina niphandrodes]|eukprot:XP_011129271.1 hypothetical protein GNI_035340 [Gregarina niphandrodes]
MSELVSHLKSKDGPKEVVRRLNKIKTGTLMTVKDLEAALDVEFLPCPSEKKVLLLRKNHVISAKGKSCPVFNVLRSFEDTDPATIEEMEIKSAFSTLESMNIAKVKCYNEAKQEEYSLVKWEGLDARGYNEICESLQDSGLCHQNVCSPTKFFRFKYDSKKGEFLLKKGFEFQDDIEFDGRRGFFVPGYESNHSGDLCSFIPKVDTKLALKIWKDAVAGAEAIQQSGWTMIDWHPSKILVQQPEVSGPETSFKVWDYVATRKRYHYGLVNPSWINALRERRQTEFTEKDSTDVFLMMMMLIMQESKADEIVKAEALNKANEWLETVDNFQQLATEVNEYAEGPIGVDRTPPANKRLEEALRSRPNSTTPPGSCTNSSPVYSSLELLSSRLSTALPDEGKRSKRPSGFRKLLTSLFGRGSKRL